jgi:ribosome-associated translation inhibitor RaiA
MQTHKKTFPVHVRTGWLDYSPALQWYVSEQCASLLERFALHIRDVSVHIGDDAATSPATRRCVIEISMPGSGVVKVWSSGEDLYATVDAAIADAVARVKEQIAIAGTDRLSRIA